MLHQEPVCAKSKFFKAACSSRWLEGQERVLRLPEVSAATFQTYCTWIYTNDIALGNCTPESPQEEIYAEETSFIDLYLLGDKLDDIQLRNGTITMLIDFSVKHNIVISMTNIALIWDSTPRGSLLRKLILDLTVTRCSREDFARHLPIAPPEYVQEVALAALWAAPVCYWEEVARKAPEYLEAQELALCQQVKLDVE